MVVRTTDRILVSEQQLEEALRVVESALMEMGLVADIEVTDERDPESDMPPGRTLMIARVQHEVPFDRLLAAGPSIDARLRAARLTHPALPLVFHLFPAW
jgi:hypothetical protein